MIEIDMCPPPARGKAYASGRSSGKQLRLPTFEALLNPHL